MTLAEQFLAGTVPDVLRLDGDWAVRALLSPLPEFRAFGHVKRFRTDAGGLVSGNNRFLNAIDVGYFTVSRGTSALADALDVIKIVYDLPRNPFFMRGLTDEVRFIAADKMLGRGVMKLPGFAAPRLVFWFTVQKV